MDDALLDEFLATTYHTCFDLTTWALIRVNVPPPGAVGAAIGTAPWGFITAWNPQARKRPDAENQAAQRRLRDDVARTPGTRAFPAIGIGRSGWSEPSLFVTGLDVAALDALVRLHSQLAYVHGEAGNPATLRILNQSTDQYADWIPGQEAPSPSRL